jgi:hypothetical protein
MKRSLDLLSEDLASLKTKLLSYLNFANKGEIINLLSKNIVYTPKYDISKSYNKLTSLKKLQEEYIPECDEDAIVCAHLNYSKDLSKFMSPRKEYQYYKDNILNYLPSEERLRFWYQKNPFFFNSNLNYNPLFGHDEDEMTFHWGPIAGLTTESTSSILEEDLNSLPFGSILVYGSMRNISRHDLGDVITISELDGQFSTKKYFLSPFKRSKYEIYSSNNILRLKYLLNVEYDFPQEVKELHKSLLNTINQIEIFQSSLDRSTKILVEKYHSNNSEAYIYILKKILKCGYYMRGWRNEKEFNKDEDCDRMSDRDHLQIEKGEVEMSRIPSAECNTGLALIDLAESMKSEEARFIGSLPLIKIVNGEYCISQNKGEGLTILDRLSLIIQGETTEDIDSCIRISSNWLCGSAHKYLVALNQNIPFDMMKIRSIR